MGKVDFSLLWLPFLYSYFLVVRIRIRKIYFSSQMGKIYIIEKLLSYESEFCQVINHLIGKFPSFLV